MKLGDVVRQYREAKGLSQREFGRRCGLSGVIISFIERGERSNGEPYSPKFDTVRKVAKGMGTTADVLLTQCDDFMLDITDGVIEETPLVSGFVKELTERTPDEDMLIQAYRLIPAEHRIEAMTAILAIKTKYEK
jgi:transcriptional regulator with XRE-family HTH domain